MEVGSSVLLLPHAPAADGPVPPPVVPCLPIAALVLSCATHIPGPFCCPSAQVYPCNHLQSNGIEGAMDGRGAWPPGGGSTRYLSGLGLERAENALAEQIALILRFFQVTTSPSSAHLGDAPAPRPIRHSLFPLRRHVPSHRARPHGRPGALPATFTHLAGHTRGRPDSRAASVPRRRCWSACSSASSSSST